MKTNSKRMYWPLAASALLFAFAATGQAGPPPDLMNSVWRLYSDAQKRCASECRSFEANKDANVRWSWLHTRNITAGQSSVAVPDTTEAATPVPRQVSQPKNK